MAEDDGAIQIIEPIVFEVEIPVIPGLPTTTTPPGVGLGGAAVKFNYTCPLSIHCGTDTPCGFNKTIALPLSIPLPVFSFPPTFNFPVFGFRFEIPPPIFVRCPAFPEEDYDAQKAADESATTPPEEESSIPEPEKQSVSTKEAIESGDTKLTDTFKEG